MSQSPSRMWGGWLQEGPLPVPLSLGRAGVSHSALRPLIPSAQCVSPVQPKVTITSLGSCELQKSRWFHLMQLLRLHEVNSKNGISNPHISTAFSKKWKEVSSFFLHAGHNGSPCKGIWHNTLVCMAGLTLAVVCVAGAGQLVGHIKSRIR